jgi:hypothetical protein
MGESIVTLVSTQTRGANSEAVLKMLTLRKIITPLLDMEHQHGQERAAWASLREQTSCRNQTARCAVQRTTHSTRKNGELNMMAWYVSCMPLASAIVVHVHCENSV